MKEIQVKCQALIGVLICLGVSPGIADTPNTRAYLDLLAARISAKPLPASAEAWKAGAAGRRQRLLRMLGLDPLPVKTPLNPRYVGEPVELESSTFQRVVFESAPGLFVAAHLCIPRGVGFPAPAVLYVPGHGMRDSYLPHALSYASKGYVTINLPTVGEEGRIDGDAGRCGHYGPYYGHFDWYSTGYTPAGAEVWDTMRAVDFLLTLKDSEGNAMVDATRIGLAGLSGGSARTFWVAAADTRIAAAVACQGFTTVANYDSTIPSTCDVHLFYNYYHQPYAEVYGNAAPRALRVIQATEDPLYKHPRPVADALAGMYRTIGKPERFSYVTFPGGHGYTPKVVAAEQEWLARWLKPEAPEIGDDASDYQANRAKLNDRANLQCFTGSRKGWLLDGTPAAAKSVREQFTPKTPSLEIAAAGSFEAMKKALMKRLREEVLVHAFDRPPVEWKPGEPAVVEGVAEQPGTLRIDGVLERRVRLLSGEHRKSCSVLLSHDLDKDLARAREIARNSSMDVLMVQVTRLKDKHLRRYAALAGHTETSMQIGDALAAMRTMRKQKRRVTAIEAGGELAIAALFASIIDGQVGLTMLQDCPDRLTVDTAILGALRHADLSRYAALIYPRRILLTGKQAPGYEWTEKVYGKLAGSKLFMRNEFR